MDLFPFYFSDKADGAGAARDFGWAAVRGVRCFETAIARVVAGGR